MPISEEDIKFLDEFLGDELTDDRMNILDEKLKDEAFKKYYQQRLDEKFDRSFSKRLSDALPMIVFVVLVILGIYLFIKSY